MTRTARALCASAALSLTSCAGKGVIPDPTIPHRLAKEADVVIWARQPDGTLKKTKARALPGWWLAGPPVVEAVP
jgi:hypothetical protein